MRYQHGGNLDELARQAGCRADEILDFSANLNPLGPPAWLRQELSRNVAGLAHYPPPHAEPLIDAIAQRYGLPRETLVAGNGSSELLFALPRASGCRRAVIPVPAYGDYLTAARQARLEVVTPRLSATTGFRLQPEELARILCSGDLVILGRPANPTATLPDAGALRDLARAHPDCLFLVDEAFVDFLAAEDTLLHDRPENVVVLRSMTKFFAVPGLRLGFVALASQLAAVLRDQLPAWSVNTLAQAVGVRALADAEYAAETRQRVAEYRTQLEGLLGALPGLHLFPSAVNYLLVEARPPAPDAEEIARHCLCEHRIAIRVCANYEGLGKRYFRVAVRTPDENERIAVALHGALGIAAKASVRMPKRRCPALMIQGTTSNAGKSVLAAAFCRILAQDGIRVAPFKAQNMSLNSFVTRAGGEMGRAQVVQAQACHLDPDVRMNPILLKPNSETGSQVIVLGKPIGNMVVGTYTDAKARLREVAFSAYDSLAAECDAIVLEGAGSPAEVNLKKHDLVNMQMARHAQAPVLLVGDIDRGGVYAAFIGTLETMEEWERQLVAGFLVNRFRGDASLLAAAHEYVRQFTGKPVLGVVRYLPKLNVPQEDSVEFKSGNGESAPTRPDAVEIVVIDLPHISNFTDFDPFRLEPDVRLRVVGRAEDLGTPDAVILPGSKNVPGDLDALMASGLGARIAALGRDSRTCVVGICGGLQMLGRTIADPHGLEAGTPGERAGLGLLDLTTILERAKTLTRTEARHLRSGESVNGYEIHHGVTDPGSAQPVFRTADGREAGVGTADGRVWGTYLHGVFDADGFRRAFLDDLRVRNGLAPLGTICASYEIETALDQLADVVRHAVKMKHIYQLMGL